MDEKSLPIVAEQAFKLWSECHVYLLRKIENQTRAVMALRAQKECEIQIPIPKKYPVSFDDFLRLTVGGRSKERRTEIYIEYAKEMIWRGHVSEIKYPRNPQSANDKYRLAVMPVEEAEKLAKPASPKEIVSVLDHANQRIYSANMLELYKIDARDFLQWLAKYKANMREKRAQAGAAGKWGWAGFRQKRQKNAQT